jgi:hypothetical protein
MRKLLFNIFFLCSGLLFAQELKLDTNNILIGQQINLKISCSFEKGESIVWPTFTDTIITGVEIVESGKMDSTENGNALTLSQNFTITSFDSGSYYIVPIVFNENLKTETTILNVRTIDLAENAEIKDIKPPIDAPYGWSDIWPFLLGILLIILIYLLLKKYVFAKKIQEIKAKPKVIIPSDIIAINSLNDLDKKQLYQSGKLKQYHSEISEILRTYLEERFHILALELPTFDILINLTKKGLAKEDLQTLATILQRADLAKYAKSKPTDLENGQSMELSLVFVKNTRKKEVQND